MMKHSSETTLDTADRLATIWSVIEARKSFPATIVVTSATQADDTVSIARGLAQASHAAGQRTGYLALAGAVRGATVTGSYAQLSIAPRGSQRESYDAALALWRSMYDVVIVNAPVLGSEGLGAHAARIADGVVIGVCDQRRVVPEDRKLVQLLGELQASIVGVVMTAAMSPAEAPRVAYDRSRVEATAH
jgi:hypothetical protein